MKNKPLDPVYPAQAAMKIVAFAVALLCSGALSPSLAQSGAAKGEAPAQRNLQVQASAAPAVNNAQRVALVIGNSAYKDAPLSNPVNDARAIAKALQESGFSVISRENTDQRAMLAALREFGDQLRGGGTGLFYYAGHGMQIKGRNYLIPVGASIEREDEVAYNAVDAQAVLDKMEAAGNIANIMILDACRNNPFTRSTRSGAAGLAQMDAPVGTLVAYATSPGAVASDGSGSNGLYTQHLLTAIRQPGNKVEDVFKQVRANVRRDSQGKQVPWESTSLEGDFYFRGGSVVVVPFDSGSAVEAALWDAVKASTLSIEIRAYLNRYPTGKFAADARAQLLKLQPVVAVAVIAAPTSQPLVAATPTPSQPAKPTKTGNHTTHINYSVGDSWTFASDKVRNLKSSAYTQKVVSLGANGDAVFNAGGVLTASGQFSYLPNFERERFYSAGYRMVPTQLSPGFKEPISYDVLSKYKDDGREVKFVGKGSIEVIGREKVSTPAGDFLAWRIRRLAQGANTNNGEELLLDHTFWFVPEVKRVVAQDIFETSVKTGKTILQERVALQSFSLADAKATAAAQANQMQAAGQNGGVSFASAGTGVAGDQAAVDQRTAELLANLTIKPVETQPVTPTPGKLQRQAALRNSAGFSVGDRWLYQTVDKFKQEVVSNWSRKINGFNSDGSIKLSDGFATWTADGAIQSLHGTNGYVREYSPAYKWVPSQLEVGRTEPIKHSMVWRNADGTHGVEERDGTLKVLAKEMIKVPAGEFEAWKVEFTGFANGKNLSKSSAYVVRITDTKWYVPALHNFVASEFEQRSQNNNIEFYERQELTSFTVRGADSFAGR